jgi:hypothetical protein
MVVANAVDSVATLLFVVFAALGAGLAVSLAGSVLTRWGWPSKLLVLFGIAKEDGATGRGPPTLEDRVAQLSGSLAVAVRQISDIEQEIQARQALVLRLRADVRRNRELIQVSETHAEAVAQVLRGELVRVERRTARRDILLGAVYFLLGSFVSLIYVFFFK